MPSAAHRSQMRELARQLRASEGPGASTGTSAAGATVRAADLGTWLALVGGPSAGAWESCAGTHRWRVPHVYCCIT